MINQYDLRQKQGKYYYQLNGKKINENYIDILKEKELKRKIQILIDKEVEKVVDKLLSEALNIK